MQKDICRGAIMTLISSARQKIGFYTPGGKLWRNRVYSHMPYLEWKPGQHMAEYYLDLLLAYDLKTENIWHELVIQKRKLFRTKALLKAENIPPDSR